MSFDERSYKSGRWVGEIIGALKHGAKSLAATWPDDALPEDRAAVEQWARIAGLRATFDDKGLLVDEPSPPNLKVVQ
jgi:hypothetical protein